MLIYFDKSPGLPDTPSYRDAHASKNQLHVNVVKMTFIFLGRFHCGIGHVLNFIQCIFQYYGHFLNEGQRRIFR